jgi:hypothetical protein
LKPRRRDGFSQLLEAAAASEAVAEVTKPVDAAKDSVATPAVF